MDYSLSISGARRSATAICLATALLACVPAAAEVANCRPISDAEADMMRDRNAVITDVDGVLTQYVLSDYVPTNGAFLDKGIAYPRTDAALLMNIYHRLDYFIAYMAFRPRNLEIVGKPSCEATLGWLYDHGFPVEKGDTVLLLIDAPEKVTGAKNKGQAMADWAGDEGTKNFTEMVEAMKTTYGIVPRYGYVDSDVVSDAYLNVGVPPEHIFSIGNKGMSSLGYRGTQAIVGPELNPGYTEHIESFVIPMVNRATD